MRPDVVELARPPCGARRASAVGVLRAQRRARGRDERSVAATDTPPAPSQRPRAQRRRRSASRVTNGSRRSRVGYGRASGADRRRGAQAGPDALDLRRRRILAGARAGSPAARPAAGPARRAPSLASRALAMRRGLRVERVLTATQPTTHDRRDRRGDGPGDGQPDRACARLAAQAPSARRRAAPRSARRSRRIGSRRPRSASPMTW